MERIYTAEECIKQLEKYETDLNVWEVLLSAIKEGDFAFIDENAGPRFWIVKKGTTTTTLNTGRFVTYDEADRKANEAARGVFLYEKLLETINSGAVVMVDDETGTMRFDRGPAGFTH